MSSLEAVNASVTDWTHGEQDLGPLAWVLEELRKSLDGTVKAMRRFVREAEIARESDLASLDVGPLRVARQQLHQASGALEMVGMTAPALILRAAESAVQKYVQRPEMCSDDAANTIERASFALIAYLESVLAGKQVSAVTLFPQYKETQALNGVERVHPADLWPVERRFREPEFDITEAPQDYTPEARAKLDNAVLRIIKLGDPSADTELLRLCLGFAAGEPERQLRAFWKIASGFFEALETRLLVPDVYVKRVASRVLLQYAAIAKGDRTVADRLVHELLFFCAQARSPGAPVAGPATPALDAVRKAFGLQHFEPVDYDIARFGLFDPAVLAQARKRISAATETWSALAGGDRNKLKPAQDQFSLVCDSLRKLHPGSEPLAAALTRAVDHTVQSGEPPSPALAMEVATAVLYLQASFEELDVAQDHMADRAQRLAKRLDGVVAGGDSEPLEAWMEELYRRVSDHQTMGSVVDELRATLADAEKSMDQFFRTPDDVAVLANVPGRMSQMRGVLSVLGLDQASQAVVHMRDTVEHLMVGEVEPEQRQVIFDKLGNSLGALGFLIDMLSYQRSMARKLFVYDEAQGELRLVMGRAKQHRADDHAEDVDQMMKARGGAPVAQPVQEATMPAPVQPLAAEPAAPAVAPATSRELEELGFDVEMQDGTIAHTDSAITIAVEPPQLPESAPMPAPGEEDDELLDIFLEEAREVIGNGQAAIQALHHTPDDLSEQTTLRRAFHTLKGSSRMVGLNEFGEAAWSMEQVLNAWLAEQKPVPTPLLTLANDSLQAFGRWVDDIAAGSAGAWDPQVFRVSAEAMRMEGRLVPLALGSAAAATALSEVPEPLAQPELPEDIPSIIETLDPLPQPDELAVESVAEVDADFPDFSETQPFELDVTELAALDAHLGASPEVVAPPIAEEIDFSSFEKALEQQDDILLQPAQDHAHSAAPEDQAELPALPEIMEFSSSIPMDLLDLKLEARAQEAKAEPAPTSDASIVDALVSLDTDTPDFAATASQLLESHVPAIDAKAPEIDLPDLDLSDFGVTDAVDAVDTPAEPTLEEPSMEDVPDLDLAQATPDPVAPESPVNEVLDTAAADVQPEPLLEAEASAVTTAPEAGQGPEADTAAEAVAQEPVAEPEQPEPELVAEEVEASAPAVMQEPDDATKVIGDLRIPMPLYNVYLGEAEEWSQKLINDLHHWIDEPGMPVPDDAIARAHSLAGSSATVGFNGLSEMARSLEHALQHIQPQPMGLPHQQEVFQAVAQDIRRLLHQFAAGFLKQPSTQLLAQLSDILNSDIISDMAPLAESIDEIAEAQEPVRGFVAPALSVPTIQSVRIGQTATEPAQVKRSHDEFDAVDVIDPDLFPIFEEEAIELLPTLGGALRQWSNYPDNHNARSELLRALHTLKGSARLAGAMRLGEMAHRMETDVEQIDKETAVTGDIEPLLTKLDALQESFDNLRNVGAQPLSEPVVVPQVSDAAPPAAAQAVADASAKLPAAVVQQGPVAKALTLQLAPVRTAAHQTVRVRAQLLDRLVNQAGEVMIARSRLDARMGQMRSSLTDLTDNLERLRLQLRDIEVQAETQMQSRLALSKDTAAGFDPLEFDRFTRVQELTRMMAESVNDVATVQRNLQRAMEGAEDDLVSQGRQARELQRDLLRTRMVEFDSISERLYALVRQSSKETGKQIKLDIAGGAIEMDRGVLDRMAPAFEHLLRNCVGHGIELPETRVAAGKPPNGTITITLRQEGNDVSVEFLDDGAGLNVARIRDKAIERGLITSDTPVSDVEAAQLIFMPGFSTANEVTGLSGRGIGMDVVRTEVNALGGRIETSTTVGQGSSFRLILPLTTAVTQVVMLRAGDLSIGVPASLVEVVRRTTAQQLEQSYSTLEFEDGNEKLPFFWAGALLQSSPVSTEAGAKIRPVVILRSAARRIAMHVDEVLGNQEVVVKNLGPQLSRLPGMAGMSVLASGAVVLIYNPVALATVYGEKVNDAARAALAAAAQPAEQGTVDAAAVPPTTAAMRQTTQVPLVLVVDDSITVRRVTQRLLQREGYRVSLAADGLQALERLQQERPTVVLSDIEMPRMDGFDLARNIRGDDRLKHLPIIMITSRIAEKHREHAMELGVNHYLGKPYSDEELLSLVQHYALLEAAE